MPKAKSNKKKRCWCTPYCGKLRTARARRNHYSQLTKEQLKYKADSETEEDYHDEQNSNKHEQHHSQNWHDASDSFKLNTNGAGELEADVEQHEMIEELKQGQGNGRTTSMADDNLDTIEEKVLDSESEVSRLPIYVGIGGNDDGIEFDSENNSFDEFDIWARYDEAEELMARMSEAEKLRHFDEMMKASEDAECWGGRMCHLSMFHACYLIKCVRT